MVRISVLNDCLQSIVNAERKGKRQVLVRPSSKVVIKFLGTMQKHGESFIFIRACHGQLSGDQGVEGQRVVTGEDDNDIRIGLITSGQPDFAPTGAHL